MTRNEIAWLAGLLEGEGCFFWDSSKGRYGHPNIRLNMCDRDVVERAKQLIDASAIRKVVKEPWKTQWSISIVCEKAAEIMRTVLPYMGERRSKKITTLLAAWNSRPGMSGAQRNRWAAKSDAERKDYMARMRASCGPQLRGANGQFMARNQ